MRKLEYVSDEKAAEAAAELEAAFSDGTAAAEEDGMVYPAPKESRSFGLLYAPGEQFAFCDGGTSGCGEPSLQADRAGEGDRKSRLSSGVSASAWSRCVAATPDDVAEIIAAGHRVYVEAGAGLGAGYTDSMYEEAGAEVLETDEEVIAKCDVIAKSGQLTENEIGMMRPEQVIFGNFRPAARRDLVDALLGSGASSFAFEMTQRDYAFGFCDCYDLGWEGMFNAVSRDVDQFIAVLDKGIRVACADDGYLRRGLVTFNGYLTNEETSAIQGRPWVSPEAVMNIDRWTLDQAPECSTVRSKNIYPAFE